MENKMEIELLVKKFYHDTLSDEERLLLLNYLKDKEPQYGILSLYQETWDKAEDYIGQLDSESIYNKIIQETGIVEVESASAKRSPKESEIRINFMLWFRYAAVFILAFGLSWLVHTLFLGKSLPTVADQIQKIDVPYGSKSRIVLPDGSTVNLNSGSSLRYSSSEFNSTSRSVSLIGEGFFNVSKDSSRPFYVTTPGIKVKVIGTTFNLKAYPEEDIEEATLVTGVVEIYSSSDRNEVGKPIVLKPNQSALFVKSQNTIHKKDTTNIFSPETEPVKLKTLKLQSGFDTEQTISWKENRLIFDNEQFSSLIVKIERWYNVKIIVNYPELNSARFTGKFDKETLEQVLNALVTVTPFNYNIRQNQITISKN